MAMSVIMHKGCISLTPLRAQCVYAAVIIFFMLQCLDLRLHTLVLFCSMWGDTVKCIHAIYTDCCTLPLVEMPSTTLSFLSNGASFHFSSYCHHISCGLHPVEFSFTLDTSKFTCFQFLFGPEFLFLNSLPICGQGVAMGPLLVCVQVYFECVSDV
jgi:hypothetical protein